MTAKEYFSQAYSLDQRINSKIEQVSRLHELATKATSTLSDMPGNSTKNTHRMEDIIIKIVDLESEINADIDRLVDLKAELIQRIRDISDPDEQTIMELRYLCFKSWTEIAVEMNCGIDNIYRVHRKALKNFKFS